MRDASGLRLSKLSLTFKMLYALGLWRQGNHVVNPRFPMM